MGAYMVLRWRSNETLVVRFGLRTAEGVAVDLTGAEIRGGFRLSSGELLFNVNGNGCENGDGSVFPADSLHGSTVDGAEGAVIVLSDVYRGLVTDTVARGEYDFVCVMTDGQEVGLMSGPFELSRGVTDV